MHDSKHIAAVLLALLAGACVVFAQEVKTNNANNNVAPMAMAARVGPDFVIGPEDTLTIQAPEVDEISRIWQVGASGDLKLPLIGKVRAAGLTVDQLEQQLVDRLKQYVREPQVSVHVSDVRSQLITVTGAVERPGLHPLRGDETLFDALNSAGMQKDAGITLTVTRAKQYGPIPLTEARQDNEGKYTVAELDTRDVMDGRSAAANLRIAPNDIINVSRVKRLVHIVGEVVKPGAVELVTQDTVSLTQVLATAGGLTRTAAPHKVRITHLNSQGLQSEVALVDLKKILSGKARDLELTSGDVIMVPSSQLAALAQTASLSAVNAGMLILGRF